MSKCRKILTDAYKTVVLITVMNTCATKWLGTMKNEHTLVGLKIKNLSKYSY
jgi:hypothetical protein